MSTIPQQPDDGGFWESRTGWRRLKETLLLEPLVGGSRWASVFGSLLLFVFLLQVITGILLTMNYAPSVETAWKSVSFIDREVPFGRFIRALHYWGASAMIVLLLVHTQGNHLDLWAAATNQKLYDAAVDLCQKVHIETPRVSMVQHRNPTGEEEPVSEPVVTARNSKAKPASSRLTPIDKSP